MKNRILNIDAPLSFGHLPKGENGVESWKWSVVIGHWSVVIGHWLAAATPDGAASPVRDEALPGSTKREAGSWKSEEESRKKETPGSKLPARMTRSDEETRSPKLEARSPNLLTKIKNQNIIEISLTLRRLAEGRERLLEYNQCNALYLPLKFWVCTKKTEGFSLLPRGSAGIGAIPGAAAITTIISFFASSPRDALKIAEPRRLARFLPVINQSTFHQGSFVPLSRGTRFAFANQGVKETIPNNWIEGTKPERRYLTNSN